MLGGLIDVIGKPAWSMHRVRCYSGKVRSGGAADPADGVACRAPIGRIDLFTRRRVDRRHGRRRGFGLSLGGFLGLAGKDSLSQCQKSKSKREKCENREYAKS